jgi:hypothetical protein
MCHAVKRQRKAGALATQRLWLAASAVAVIAFAEIAKADDAFLAKAPAIPFSGLIGPAYNWEGFYAGGHMGLAWGQSNWTAGPGLSGTTNLFQPIDSFDEGGSFFFGLQGGYNYVLPNRILMGAEVDASFPSFQTLSGISIGGISNFTSPTLGTISYSEKERTQKAGHRDIWIVSTKPDPGCEVGIGFVGHAFSGGPRLRFRLPALREHVSAIAPEPLAARLGRRQRRLGPGRYGQRFFQTPIANADDDVASVIVFVVGIVQDRVN